VRARIDFKPEIALILGSGLGDFGETIEVVDTLSYSEIEGFPVSTVAGHKGRYIFGYVNGVPVVCMQGRVHYYEGYLMTDVVLPTRLMKMMGAKVLFLTNASGGINPALRPGDFVIIRDHINLVGCNPLVGAHREEWGERFLDMTEVYNRHLAELLHASATKLDLRVMDGVYAYTSGPCYETPAEIQAYKAQGADVVGMSTVPEAVFAKACGMKVAGISLVSNLAAGISRRPLNHEEVVSAGANAKPMMSAFIEDFLERL
jgi:purine-nucleoside phosphorylase